VLRPGSNCLWCCCVLLCTLSGSASYAQLPARVSLRWSSDASCPKPETFDAQVAERLGTGVAKLQPVELEVRIDEGRGGLFRLALEAETAEAELAREVELVSCAEAQRAAVVLVATALAPERVGRAREEQVPARWTLRAGLLGDLRSLPGPSGGPTLGVGYAPLERLRLWADARYLFARETEPLGAQRAQIDLAALAVGAAGVWTRGAWLVGPGLELEAGALRGRAAGPSAAGSRAAPWLAVWAGTLAGYCAGRVCFLLAILVGVPLLRPEFVLQDPSQVYRTAALGARAQLGVAITLGAKKRAGAGQ
jgi:hypothetical protein